MKRELFNNDWKFWKDGDSFALVWDVPENARLVTLPHDAMIELTPDKESLNGGNTGFRDGQNYVYVKTLTVTPQTINQKWILHFDGSYMNTFVYINEQFAGKHHFGYTGFDIDISEFIEVGDNEIRVQVRNSAMNNSRWYSGSGLYRDVYLLTSDLLHFGTKGSQVHTVEVANSNALLNIDVPVKNESINAKSVLLKTIVKNPKGEVVITDTKPYFIKKGDEITLTQRYVIKDVELWNVDTPRLYSVENELIVDNLVVDTDYQKFGIRTIAVDSLNGLRINNEAVKLRGACIHHDNGLLGAVSFDSIEKFRVQRLKEAGFNALRMSHHPASPALLRACDEIGMLMMDETFDMWTRFKGDFDYSLVFQENWRKDVQSMVETDFNHPSVIMYSIGNEIPEIGTPHGSHLAREIHTFIKSLDNTRPTVAGINGVFAVGDQMSQIMADVMAQNAAEGNEIKGDVNNFMTLLDTNMDKIVIHPKISDRLNFATASTDIAGYNYMTARYQGDSMTYPHRIMVGSETYPPAIAKNWKIIKALPSVIGDFTWTGWDYIGEAGVGVPAYEFGEGGFGAQFPCQLAYCGDINIIGVRRPLSYYREIVFGLRQQPYIAVQRPEHYGKNLIKTPWVLSDTVSSWTWTGYEGKPIVVEVYAPGDKVALYLNGKLIEEKENHSDLDYRTIFELNYHSGELKAVNYLNNKVVSESILNTAKKDVSIDVEVETVDENLAYVHFSLVDDVKTLVVNQDIALQIEVEGGELLGVGSGNPKTLEHYQGTVATTFEGHALAIIRKNNTVTKLTVTSNLEKLTINI